MSRYIDADALIEELESCSYETWSKGVNRTWWAQAVNVKDNIKRCIDRQPTADAVEVRHGKWEYKQLDEYKYYQVTCPFCGAQYWGNYDAYNEPDEFNYCPNCGAKMDGERKEENEG
jgi:hypothetical protein